MGVDTSPAALGTVVAQRFPATAKFLSDWTTTLRAKAFAIAASQQARVKDFAQANKIQFKALPWMLIAPGILLALLAFVALLRPAAVVGPGRPAQPDPT